MSWTASGRPSSPWNSGTAMAGWPEMFMPAVYGVNWPARRNVSSGLSWSGSSVPIGTGDSARPGVRIAS